MKIWWISRAEWYELTEAGIFASTEDRLKEEIMNSFGDWLGIHNLEELEQLIEVGEIKIEEATVLT